MGAGMSEYQAIIRSPRLHKSARGSKISSWAVSSSRPAVMPAAQMGCWNQQFFLGCGKPLAGFMAAEYPQKAHTSSEPGVREM